MKFDIRPLKFVSKEKVARQFNSSLATSTNQKNINNEETNDNLKQNLPHVSALNLVRFENEMLRHIRMASSIKYMRQNLLSSSRITASSQQSIPFYQQFIVENLSKFTIKTYNNTSNSLLEFLKLKHSSMVKSSNLVEINGYDLEDSLHVESPINTDMDEMSVYGNGYKTNNNFMSATVVAPESNTKESDIPSIQISPSDVSSTSAKGRDEGQVKTPPISDTDQLSPSVVYSTLLKKENSDTNDNNNNINNNNINNNNNNNKNIKNPSISPSIIFSINMGTPSLILVSLLGSILLIMILIGIGLFCNQTNKHDFHRINPEKGEQQDSIFNEELETKSDSTGYKIFHLETAIDSFRNNVSDNDMDSYSDHSSSGDESSPLQNYSPNRSVSPNQSFSPSHSHISHENL